MTYSISTYADLGDPSPFFFRPGRSGVAHHDGEVREAIRGAGWCLDGNEVEGAIGARVGVLATDQKKTSLGVPRGLRKFKKPITYGLRNAQIVQKKVILQTLEDSGTLRCHQTWL